MATEEDTQRQRLVEKLFAVQQQAWKLPRDKTANIPTQRGGRIQYSYTSLTGLMEAVAPVLAEHNLYLHWFHDVRPEDGECLVEAVVACADSGEQRRSGHVRIPIANDTPQAIGSGITYGRRYTAASLLGLVSDDDDDGQQGSGRPQQTRQKPQRQASKPQRKSQPQRKPQPKQASKPADPSEGVMSGVAIEDIQTDVKTGTTQQGKAWSLNYVFVDGDRCGYFKRGDQDDNLDRMIEAAASGEALDLAFEETQYGKRITNAQPAADSGGDAGIASDDIPF